MFTSFPNVIDRFSSDRCPSRVLFSDERHRLSLNSSLDSYITIYGELSIDHGRFEWAIKVNKCGDKQGIIGVATGLALSRMNGKFSDDINGYGFCLNGLFRNGGQIINNTNLNNNGSISLHEGDILFIRIDLNNQILSFAKNGILLDIQITNIPQNKYRLAISIYDENESYSIVSPSEYLSKFSLYQHKLSILPLQDRFKYIGKPNKNYLKLLVHNTSVIHIDNIKKIKIKKKILYQQHDNDIDEEDIYIDTAYGSRWISRGIFEWILQIQGENIEFLHIGVYGHNKENLNVFKSQFEHSQYGYGITHNGYRLRNQFMARKQASHSRTNSDYNLGIEYDTNEKYKYCSGFSLLDLVHIRLDLIKKTLSFTRNGTDLGIAYKNIYIVKDFGYRLAVKLKKPNCRISIVSAHPVTNQERLTLNVTPINNNTMNQNGITTTTNKRRQSKTVKVMRKTKSSGDIPINDNNDNNKEDKKQDDNDNDNDNKNDNNDNKQIFNVLNEIKTNMNKAKIMIDSICDKFDKLNENELMTPKNASSSSLSSLSSKSSINNKTNDNNNNFIMLLPQLLLSKRTGNELLRIENDFNNSLTNWMNKITPKIIGHFKNWELWNSDDITDWIISIENGRFSKYEQILRTEMKRAELKGKHIKTLAQNITYLQRFGIVKFEEEMALQKYLNQLINGQYQQNMMKQLILSSNSNAIKSITPKSSKPRTPNHIQIQQQHQQQKQKQKQKQKQQQQKQPIVPSTMLNTSKSYPLISNSNGYNNNNINNININTQQIPLQSTQQQQQQINEHSPVPLIHSIHSNNSSSSSLRSHSHSNQYGNRPYIQYQQNKHSPSPSPQPNTTKLLYTNNTKISSNETKIVHPHLMGGTATRGSSKNLIPNRQFTMNEQQKQQKQQTQQQTQQKQPYLQFYQQQQINPSFPVQKSPKPIQNNDNNDNNDKNNDNKNDNNKSSKPSQITPQEKIRQIEHEYHENQLQRIVQERAKLEKEKKELAIQRLIQQKQSKTSIQSQSDNNNNNNNDNNKNEEIINDIQ